MLFYQIKQFFPQIRVQGRLFIGFAPAVLPPGCRPALTKAVDHILGVRVQLHPARFFQRFQTGDHCQKLHPVIGGIGIATGKLLFHPVIAENCPPATGTGITGAGTVGI